MQPDGRLIGEAATLEQKHKDVLDRLPATVYAFILVELQKWSTLFAAEQRYQRTLLQHLSRLASNDLAGATDGIARIEAEAGINRLSRRDPTRLQDDGQALLRKQRLLAVWRKEIDGFFQQIDPALEAQLYPPDAPRRLIVQLYGNGIAVQTKNLWSRFKGTGIRIPLQLESSRGADTFLRALFGRPAEIDNSGGLFSAMGEGAGPAHFDPWIIESHEALHRLFGERTPAGEHSRQGADAGHPVTLRVTGLSYDRLRTYRDELMKLLYGKILSGVESPQAFAAYARSLKITPAFDPIFTSSDPLQAFVRDVFLTGNGTLFVNNTFVEWAAVQALRRAQPRVLVTRFGVRDKLKPFSSLLLFSQPRPSDQIPLIEDPVGSFVDVELLSYYVWLNAEKSPAYRNKTLYLFLAEGIDEMLAIRSEMQTSAGAEGPASTLFDVHATMAEWLNLPAPRGPGRPIAVVIS